MNRIYHPYWKWEDYKAGFYDNCSGDKKTILIKSVIEMFSSEELTRTNMYRVQEWQYSCEHNLTNISLNRIAYIGQAACCIYASVPSTVTMEAWSLLSKDIQTRSDLIAEEFLNYWLEKNKRIQLCLNFI